MTMHRHLLNADEGNFFVRWLIERWLQEHNTYPSTMAKHFKVQKCVIYHLRRGDTDLKNIVFLNDLIGELGIAVRLLIYRQPYIHEQISDLSVYASRIVVHRKFSPVEQLEGYLGSILSRDGFDSMRAVAKRCQVSDTVIRDILYKDHLISSEYIKRVFNNLGYRVNLLVCFKDDAVEKAWAKARKEFDDSIGYKPQNFHIV